MKLQVSYAHRLTRCPAHNGTIPFDSFLSGISFTEAFVPLNIYKPESATIEGQLCLKLPILTLSQNFWFFWEKMKLYMHSTTKLEVFTQNFIFFSIPRILD